MGRYADLRESYLLDRRPQLYKELKAAGRLKSHCLERERDDFERKCRMMSSGLIYGRN